MTTLHAARDAQIEKLAAENARLREALERIANYNRSLPGDTTLSHALDWIEEQARAALAEPAGKGGA